MRRNGYNEYKDIRRRSQQMRRKTILRVVLIGVVLTLFFAVRITNSKKNREIKEFTAFFDVPGNEIDEDNEIRELIAQKIGARCQEQWLSGKSADEAIASYIASGEYTDFISGNMVLYEAGALIPIDVYWDDYPNIKNF